MAARLPVAILGASGYAGGELIRLLDTHPVFDLVYLGGHGSAGAKLGDVHPHLGGGGRTLGSNDPSEVPDVAVVFLALPHGGSAVPGTTLADRGAKVVDLGSDFRLDTDERYLFAYGARHPSPGSLPAWQYGLPELFDISEARLVASPGCYPTAALLAIGPLLRSGLIAADGIVIDALSGVSGAGRAVRADLQFGSVDENVRAYAAGRHRHRPEIEMGLEMVAGRAVRLTFTPHLVPMQRGIAVTATVRPAGTVGREDVLAVMADAYTEAAFVTVTDRIPETRWVVGSNNALVGAYTDTHAGTIVVLSVIDNLIKGAAGQAIQNANLMCGVDETAGLPRSGWTP